MSKQLVMKKQAVKTVKKAAKFPVSWSPYPFQLPLWRYLYKGGKKAIAIWHRRAGKFKAVEIIAALVRPIVTYGTFLLYCSLKLLIVYFCLKVIGCVNLDIIEKVWTEEDWALFFGVITFWFGQRSINKTKQ